jgi:hypothetical protein
VVGEGARLDQTPDRDCPKARCQGLYWSIVAREHQDAQPTQGPGFARAVALREWYRVRRVRVGGAWLKGEGELACFLQGYFWLLDVPRMPSAVSN